LNIHKNQGQDYPARNRSTEKHKNIPEYSFPTNIPEEYNSRNLYTHGNPIYDVYVKTSLPTYD